MACSHPYYNIYNNRKKPIFLDNYIPCGMCLNCRKDKQNELTHRCEYELITFKCGAFVTLTYDDYHIIDKLRHDSAGKLVATLSRRDAQLFQYRLRKNIQRHLPNCILSNHNFKSLCVGEYGGDGQIFDRPHFHFLFFGLDFAYCKREIERSWNGQGMIKVLPILNGGIRYVLKYLDKQLFGKQAQIKYDDNNLQRPFQTHSIGLGSNLYKSQLDYIKSHHGKYRFHGRDVPVPMYYKNKFLITQKDSKWDKLSEKYKLFHGFSTKNLYDLHDFSIRQAQIREDNLNNKLSQIGRPRFDFIPKSQLSKSAPITAFGTSCR